MPEATTPRTLLVDGDVHCVPPTPAALYPYLPVEWVEFMQNTEFKGVGAVGTTYPRWLPMLATDGGELTVERVREDVLSEATVALLHCYYGLESFTHPGWGPSMATAVNRWLEAEWLDSDDRLLAYAAVTPQHVAAAVQEIERIAADRRFVGIFVPARAPAPYGHRRYWPIWEAAAAHDLAVGIGFGGATGTPPTPVSWLGSFWEEYAAGTLTYQGHVASLAICGLLDRHPNLRFVIHESGWTWLPALCWRVDQEWRGAHREVPWMDGPPSSYVRRFMRFTSQPIDVPPDPRFLRQVVDQLGMDRLLIYSSDYPHEYDSGNELLFDVLTDEEAARVRWQNAADCYRLREGVPGSHRRSDGVQRVG
jgi:predicted TIM-barrel fold metal-dependent hydrolase